MRNTINFIIFGWLDFIEDETVLKLLLNKAEEWAKENGMEHIHGPMGFISLDNVGVLVDGFNEFPTSFSHYNYPYYGIFLEKLGYRMEKDWIEYQIKVPAEVPENVSRYANLIKKRYNLREAELKNKKDVRKYTKGVLNLFNTAYKGLFMVTELNEEQIALISKKFVKFLQPDFVSLIVNKDDDIVAFGISTPSLARALKKCNGSLFPFGYLHVMRALKKNDTVDLLLIGVAPEYWGKGLISIIFEKIMSTAIKKNIKYAESNREEETNTKVKNLWHAYEHRLHKRARCYMKKLD